MVSCNLDPLEADQSSNFDKLYAVSENVEAIDFICKPDLSGYIIVGNIKSPDNSDIILINVGADGMQDTLRRIITPTYDEAVSIKINEDDNSVWILAHRKFDPSQPNVDQNILFKSDLNGIPIQATNRDAEDSLSAEFKILNISDNFPVQLNDFLIIPPNLITVGQIRESASGNYNRLTQIFDINSINFNDKNDSIVTLLSEKPTQKNYNNSRYLKIMRGHESTAVYEVLGQNFSENPNNEINGPSENINWDIFTEVESDASERIFIGSDRNEGFGDILYHSNGKIYIGGNYLDTDMLFLIAKDYTGTNNNTDQEIIEIDGYGNRIASLSEDDIGNIIMATVDEGEINNISNILKFSQAGDTIDNQSIKFRSTGLNEIIKIENEPGNVLVILSQKTFENNSTAIGLMKIKF
jgi:hypothetical protein